MLYSARMLRPFGAFSGPLLMLIAATFGCGEAPAADGPPLPDAAVAERNPIEQLRRDAEHGNERAQYELGCCYNGERGLQRDPAEAAKWWGMAAAKGVADAQYCLGLIYCLGDGVPRDPVLAAKWLKKAAEQDHSGAQYFLALSYRAGLGVPRSPQLASYWLNRAASQGSKPALELLRTIGSTPG
jgi:TPR repeat protein